MNLNIFSLITCKIKKNNKAFTLVEALVALSILIIGVISGFVLVTKALYDVSVIQDRLTASFLAQEGIELVRQIRDTNYLKQLNGKSVNWDDGLKDGTYIISTDISSKKVVLTPLNGIQYLKYDDNTGLYNYTTGKETTFERTINIKHVSSDEIRVDCTMSWISKGIKFSFTVEDHLLNWLKL